MSSSPVRGIKFEHYSKRKGFIENNKSGVVSYIEPFKYAKHTRNQKTSSIDMSKHVGRSFNTLFLNNFPSPCDYNPNWLATKGKISKKIKFADLHETHYDGRQFEKTSIKKIEPSYKISKIMKANNFKINAKLLDKLPMV